MGVLIFGAGQDYERLHFWLEKLDVIAFLDNNPIKQGSKMYGHRVYAPSHVAELDFSFIFVLGKYEEEMRSELLSLGIDSDRILKESDIGRALEEKLGTVEPELIFPAEWKGERSNNFLKKNKKNILLFSHDLNLTGAPLALLYVAKVLRNLGYFVVVATGNVAENDLRGEYAKLGVPIVHDYRIKNVSFRELEWAVGFDLFWVNTVTLWRMFIDRRPSQTPVVWWLHEPNGMYSDLSGFLDETLTAVDWNDVHVYGVSEVANHALKSNCSAVSVEGTLLFGMEDFSAENDDAEEEKFFVFALIGQVNENKGHDVLLRAIRGMPESIVKRCRFWLIGNIGTTTFASSIRKQAECMEEVVLFGKKSREEMTNLLKRIDAVIVPSQEETLSIAAIEGMMNKKAVICSNESAVGIASYVREAEAGLLVKPGNTKELTDAMVWAEAHREEWRKMGERGRLTYEQYFSLHSLEKRLGVVMNRTLYSRNLSRYKFKMRKSK